MASSTFLSEHSVAEKSAVADTIFALADSSYAPPSTSFLYAANTKEKETQKKENTFPGKAFEDTTQRQDTDQGHSKSVNQKLPSRSYADTHDDKTTGGSGYAKKRRWKFCKNMSVLGIIIFLRINVIQKFFSDHKKRICLSLQVILALGITCYVVAAMIRDLQRALPLVVIWCLVFTYQIYLFIKTRCGGRIVNGFKPLRKILANNQYWIKWTLIACIIIGFIVWIIVDTLKRPYQLISGVGYFVFLFLISITSKLPDDIKWRPVVLGLFLQYICGLVILRTQSGFTVLGWVGALSQTFIDNVNHGVGFLFGEAFTEHYVAFKVLPIIIFFGSFIGVMYYLGAMQWLIMKIAWLMQFSLNTSAPETMVAAGNIFVGQIESPLLIQPYIHDLTTSELHAVMTTGFGTVAGSVLGAYLGFGIQPVYVISACVMAAPCSLAISKLVYPETNESKFAASKNLILKKTEHRNIIEAAFVGASQAIPLVMNIAANLIAFLSLLAAVNGFLGWFGGLLDYPELSFETVASYLFSPVTFLMGIEWKDCFKAAELLGTKIFLNELIAYEELGEMIKIRDNGTMPHTSENGTVNWIDERSETIITYALCGFANIGSMGIMLGGLGAMVPSKQGEITKIVTSALASGVFVSILNACVAGFLYVPQPIVCANILSTINWTDIDSSRIFECCSSAMLTAWPNSTEVRSCCNYNWNMTSLRFNCSSI